MIEIEEYILLPSEARKAHLKLSEECINRGGSQKFLSSELRGLLAYILDTTIPVSNRRIYICHACHNGKCSNPYHIYWGTPRENWQDAVDSGKTFPSTWAASVAKYGREEAGKIPSRLRKVTRNGRESTGSQVER